MTEGIFNHIVLFFHPGMIASKAQIIQFCPDEDCGYSFVHSREPRNKVTISLINHKSASKFVLVYMAAVIYILSCPSLFLYGSAVRPTFHEGIRQLHGSA